MKITAVVNTYNEEQNISHCLKSARQLADKIVVVDMHSTDQTVEIAKKFGAKVFEHDYVGYVEPARNFALKKATGDWILIIDADEELPDSLARELKKIVAEDRADYVVIPRKNIIFGKWIKHSRWWPDYQVRFFKKGKVQWDEKIHSIPETTGKGTDIEAKEENALIHRNYSSISQYLERNNRYSEIMASGLVRDGYDFNLTDLIGKPANEFLGRYFAGKGYLDGIHGLILAALQAFEEFVMLVKVWEKQEFKQIEVADSGKVMGKAISDFYFWQSVDSKSLLKKIYFKLKSKF